MECDVMWLVVTNKLKLVCVIDSVTHWLKQEHQGTTTKNLQHCSLIKHFTNPAT